VPIWRIPVLLAGAILRARIAPSLGPKARREPGRDGVGQKLVSKSPFRNPPTTTSTGQTEQ
jgi:hypothetical protein